MRHIGLRVRCVAVGADFRMNDAVAVDPVAVVIRSGDELVFFAPIGYGRRIGGQPHVLAQDDIGFPLAQVGAFRDSKTDLVISMTAL